MDDRGMIPAGTATGAGARRATATWIPCPTCWGQRRILEPDRAPGAPCGALVARACPGCLGIGEVVTGEPAPPAGEPAAPVRAPAVAAAPAALPGGWIIPRRARAAIRAGAAVGCALAAGAVAAFVAPLLAAAVIGGMVGVFCHLSFTER